MWKFFFISVFFFISFLASSQRHDSIFINGIVKDGDTIPFVLLKEVRIYSWGVLSPKEERQLTRLMKNVKVVYPYARLAGIKLVEYEDTLAQAPDDQAR